MPNDSSAAKKLPKRDDVPSESVRLSTPKKIKKKYKMFSVRLGVDMTFLFVILLLLIIGLIMMFSASYPDALQYEGNSYYYLMRQLGFAAIGVTLMIFVSYFDYHHLHKLAFPVLLLSLALLVVVLFVPSSSGVHRWIDFGLFDLQASEVSKFAIILFMAHWSSVHFNQMDTFKVGVLPGVLILVATCVLLFLEPHYSGIVIMIILMAVMMFIGGVKVRYFVIAGVAVVSVVVILLVTDKLGYAMERLDGWGQALTYVNEDLWQATYQTRNSLYAIGSGGFWGLGLGQSRQKYLYIPEAQNDFVFAVVCEELGFIGAFIILLIFAFFVWRGITISMRAKDKFGTLLGIGLTAQVGIQVVLNILVITDWLPNTGISLPFFSYGGSSLIMILAQMGIVLSISRTSNIEKV